MVFAFAATSSTVLVADIRSTNVPGCKYTGAILLTSRVMVSIETFPTIGAANPAICATHGYLNYVTNHQHSQQQSLLCDSFLYCARSNHNQPPFPLEFRGSGSSAPASEQRHVKDFPVLPPEQRHRAQHQGVPDQNEIHYPKKYQPNLPDLLYFRETKRARH